MPLNQPTSRLAPALECKVPRGLKSKVTLGSGQFLECGIGVKYYPIETKKVRQELGLTSEQMLDWSLDAKSKPEQVDLPIQCSLSDKDILRWTTASDALKNLGAQESLRTHDLKKKYFTKRAKNFVGHTAGILMLASLILLATLYGGINYSVHSGHFPTNGEALFWKVSCYILMGTSPCILIVTVLPITAHTLFPPGADRSVKRWQMWAHQCNWIGSFPFWLGSLGTSVLGCLYVISRVFLVVESFISLRSVPLGVYATPDWTNFFPHL